MLDKEKVTTAIKSLLDEFTIGDVLETLTILQKIENGLKQVENGDVLTTEEAKAKFKSKFPRLDI